MLSTHYSSCIGTYLGTGGDREREARGLARYVRAMAMDRLGVTHRRPVAALLAACHLLGTGRACDVGYDFGARTIAVGDSTVILLTPPSPSILKHLLKGEGGCGRMTVSPTALGTDADVHATELTVTLTWLTVCMQFSDIPTS